MMSCIALTQLRNARCIIRLKYVVWKQALQNPIHWRKAQWVEEL